MLMLTVMSGSAFILIVRLGSVHMVSGVRGCVLVDSRVRGIFIQSLRLEVVQSVGCQRVVHADSVIGVWSYIQWGLGGVFIQSGSFIQLLDLGVCSSSQ